MLRTAINVLVVCAVSCCATAQPTHAADTTPTPDTRMTRLAQRLADKPEAVSTSTPLVSTQDSTETANPATAEPAQASPVKRTPLLRPGSDDLNAVPERPGTMAWIMQTITALGVVIGLALVVKFLYGRMGGTVASHASPVVEVLSRTTVAPRSHVMLLRVGGRVLVVSDSSAGMRTLASLQDAEEVADILGAVSASKPTSITRGFSQFLHRFSDDHDQDMSRVMVDDLRQPTGKVRDSVSNLLARVRSMGRDGGASS